MKTDEEWVERFTAALEYLQSLPQLEQDAHWEAQRKSWVKGQMMLHRPELTEESFEAIWEKIK